MKVPPSPVLNANSRAPYEEQNILQVSQSLDSSLLSSTISEEPAEVVVLEESGPVDTKSKVKEILQSQFPQFSSVQFDLVLEQDEFQGKPEEALLRLTELGSAISEYILNLEKKKQEIIRRNLKAGKMSEAYNDEYLYLLEKGDMMRIIQLLRGDARELSKLVEAAAGSTSWSDRSKVQRLGEATVLLKDYLNKEKQDLLTSVITTHTSQIFPSAGATQWELFSMAKQGAVDQQLFEIATPTLTVAHDVCSRVPTLPVKINSVVATAMFSDTKSALTIDSKDSFKIILAVGCTLRLKVSQDVPLRKKNYYLSSGDALVMCNNKVAFTVVEALPDTAPDYIQSIWQDRAITLVFDASLNYI